MRFPSFAVCLALVALPRSAAVSRRVSGDVIGLPKCCSPGQAFDSKLQNCVRDVHEVAPKAPTPDVLFVGITQRQSSSTKRENSSFAWHPTPHGLVPDCASRTDGAVFRRVVRNRDEEDANFAYHHDSDGSNDRVADKYGNWFKDFCFDLALDEKRESASGTVAVLCERDRSHVCADKPCFQLCCPEWHVSRGDGGGCQEVTERAPPPELYVEAFGGGAPRKSDTLDDIRYFHQDRFQEACSDADGNVFSVAEGAAARLFEDGSLRVEEGKVPSVSSANGEAESGNNGVDAGNGTKSNATVRFGHDEFCLRHLRGGERDFLVCRRPDPEPAGASSLEQLMKELPRAVTVAMLTSIVSYLLTFLIVLIRRRHSLFGVMLLFVIASQGTFFAAITCITVGQRL